MKNYRWFLAVAALAVCASVFAEEPTASPILCMETGSHTAPIRRISSDAKGRFFLTASDDKTARLWDAEGRPLKVFRVPRDAGNEGKLYSCAISPDGNTVAAGGWTGYQWDGSDCIYIFDRQNGSILKVVSGLPNVINHISFSPDGSLMGCALGGSNGVRVFETKTWTPVFEDKDFGGESYSFIFSRDGRYAASGGYDGFIRLYRVKPLGLLAKVQGADGLRPYGLSFSPDGKLLACGYDSETRLDVFSVTDRGLSLSFAPDITGIDNGDLSSVAFSVDGKFLAAGGLWDIGGPNPVRVWSKGGKGSYKDLDVAASNTIMDMTALPDGSLLVGSAEPAMTRVSPEQGILFTQKLGVADYRNNRDGLRLSFDGRIFSYAYVSGGTRPASFDIASRRIEEPLAGLNSPETKSLAITDWINTYQPKLNGKALEIKMYEKATSLAIAPDSSRFLMGTSWTLRCFDSQGKELWEKPAPGSTWGVNVSRDGKVGVAAYGDGTIRFYRMSDGREFLAFFPHADGKRWALFTPSGYYDASPGAEELLGWHLNNGKDKTPDFFSVSRFRSRFYRPDVVSLAFETLDEDSAVARADSEAGRKEYTGSIAASVPPVISIVYPDSGVEISQTKLTVKYFLRTPSGEPVTALRVLVDGRPSGLQRGLSVAPLDGNVFSIDVDLPERDAVVSLIAENRYAASEPATLRTVWKGKAAGDFEIKPKLYILAVGVSAYDLPALRLGFAAKDAKDFAAAASRQKGKLYRDVELKVLTDSGATKDEILDGLEWIQRATTSKDVAMVFLSGHGINDPTGVYYYLPVNADPERLKRTCLPFTDVQTTVQAIAGKALFFIDTCHSGNIMGSTTRRGAQDINAVVNELSSAENGAVVFAASTGNQYSIEKEEWENGAFTKALVEGLMGKADYNGTGRITVNMLDLYLSERVKQLTAGTQTPTTTKPPSVPDFPLAVK